MTGKQSLTLYTAMNLTQHSNVSSCLQSCPA